MLFIVFLALIIASCTVTEELTFNKDFSGKGVISYNISLYEEDEVSADSAMLAQIALAEEYKTAATAVSGISNVSYKIDEEEEMIWFYFDFGSPEALNALYMLQLFDEAPILRKTFTTKGSKRIAVTWPVHDLTPEDRESWSNTEDEMAAMYTHELILNLPRGVKSQTQLDTAKVSTVVAGNQVIFKGPWGSFYTQTEPMIWKAKLK
jgi:hypothetical protein